MVIDAKLPPKEADDDSVPHPPPSYPSPSETLPYQMPIPASPSTHAPLPAHPAYPQAAYVGASGQFPITPSYLGMGAQYQQQLFARCAQGDHDVTRTFGLCGIICAVLLFPVGFICLFTDSDKKCARCGVRLE